MSAMLEVKDLVVSYGKIKAVKGISFTVEEGDVVTLIGTNGAGKTTTLRTISGLLRPVSGSITFKGQDITKVEAHDIVQLGLAHSPEGRRIFPRLTVEENLLLGGYTRPRSQRQEDLARVFELFPVLEERLGQKASSMSGGQRQMVALGRALMARPTLLLLDEPSLGLAPRIIGQIGEVIAEINRQGTSVLLVEQNATMALGVADLAYVLDVGEVSLSGDARELAQTDEVQRLYLGHDSDQPQERAPVSGKTLSRWTS